jgi:PAS domain-containing protein
VIGRNASEFLHPDDLDHCDELRLARAERARNTDLRYIHKDGRIVTLS